MRFKRNKISPSRKDYSSHPSRGGSNQAKEPDILDIWQQQQRMRERETQLEREYEAAKQNLKDVKLRMRQNDSLLADSTLLHTSFRESIGQSIRGFWLWLKKTARKINLRAEIFYIRFRLRLGVPLRGRTSFAREKVVLACLVIAITGALIVLPSNEKPSNDTVAVQGSSQSAAGDIPLDQEPDFPVLSPGGNGTSQLGGYAKVSPPGAPATYTYLDRIEDVGIKVSQQELPEKLKDKDELEKMAKDFNATRMLTTDDGVVFVGQSINGPQSLVLQRDGLLILISSDSEIADSSWIEYMNSLAI